MYEKIKETAEFLINKGFVNAEAGIVLGTGLGGFTSAMTNCIEINYQDIPISAHRPLKVMKAS